MSEERAKRRILAGRLRWLSLMSALIFALLVLRLWQIQVIRGAELRRDAANNRFVSREIEADRGVIYDSEGEQVVLNRPQFAVRVVPAGLPEDPEALDAVLDRVAELLSVQLADERAAQAQAASRSEEAERRGLDRPESAASEGESETVSGADESSGLSDDPAFVAAETDEDASQIFEEPSAEALAAKAEARRALERLLPKTESGRLIRGWQSVTVARNVPRRAAFALMEDELQLPGVSIGESSVREYPAGPTLAHLLGFAGNIPAEQEAGYREQGYQPYDVVGRTALEYTYEADLRGLKGEKVAMVDALGRELAEVDQPRAPVPGRSLQLSVSLSFQRQVEEALQAGLDRIGAKSGAVVAIDPRSGAIRSMVSLPTFDNNLFSTGASPDQWKALLDNPNKPMLNRAISGQYTPGSVFKMVTTSATLQEGILSAGNRISCPGVIHLQNEYFPDISYPFSCWLSHGHGSMDAVGAMANSCDVYFYEVSGGGAHGRPAIRGLGSHKLGIYAERFGLGALTEVELLGEAPGLVPSPEWLAETFGLFWGTGQTYIMGIGQSYTLVTPLQMANATAAVANGGTLYRPHLVERITDHGGEALESRVRRKDILRRADIDPRHLDVVRRGMREAVQSGTAQSAWTGLPNQIAIAGKTGTAEFCDVYTLEDGVTKDCRRTRDGYLLTHAWFVAFAPYDDPEIAVAVFVDGSGLDYIIEGSRHAAPIAADVIRAYFDLPPRRAPASPSPDPAQQPAESTDSEGEAP